MSQTCWLYHKNSILRFLQHRSKNLYCPVGLRYRSREKAADDLMKAAFSRGLDLYQILSPALRQMDIRIWYVRAPKLCYKPGKCGTIDKLKNYYNYARENAAFSTKRECQLVSFYKFKAFYLYIPYYNIFIFSELWKYANHQTLLQLWALYLLRVFSEHQCLANKKTDVFVNPLKIDDIFNVFVF